ncbi:hypothetical protein AB0F13_24800 [Streptomyces sp. NPDC026206]|uniref:Rv1733c family protein n=1 Tax=Streptomyces sp. NPDC026206 TaxID=3157089 RepID=UPI0033E811B0
MRATTFVWRWRRNPLRRRSDVLEAWAGAAAVLLMLVVGPALGWVTGSLAHEALRETVHEQHRHRHLVSAIALRSVSGGSDGTDHESTAGREDYRRVLARWQAPGDRARTALVAVRQPARPGERFALWTDDRGQVAGRPMDGATATVHAVLAGLGTAAAVAGLLEGARRLVVWRLTQRRYAQWDRAWERAAHTWGRADAGS